MTTFSNFLYRLANGFSKYMGLILTGFLCVTGFLFTCYAENMETQTVLTRFENPLFTLLFGAIFLLLLYIIQQRLSRYGRKGTRLLMIVVFAWYLLAGVVLILFSKTVPSADPMSVYQCAEALAEGNTGVIHPTDSYLSYYPQQIGLVAYYEICIRFWQLFPIGLQAYHFIKLLNIFWACGAIYFQSMLVRELFETEAAVQWYLLLMLCHAPFLMYTSYVYGEIPSFSAFSIGLWALIRFLKTKHAYGYAALSILAFGLAVLFRKNTLVLMIAVIAVLAVYGLYKRNAAMLITALLYALCSVSVLPAVQSVYERRAGMELASGVPAFAYFAMAMQDEPGRAGGWYNGFNFNTYQATGMDTELTVAVSKEVIAERLQVFQEDPAYCIRFYFNKYRSQWCDGTYASRQATLATFGGRRDFFVRLYEGDLSVWYVRYCHILLTAVYLGAFLFFLQAVRFKTGHTASVGNKQGRFLTRISLSSDEPAARASLTGLPVYIGIIGVFGGLLFHTIWEANSRYVLAYGLLLVPYAAAGFSILKRKA